MPSRRPRSSFAAPLVITLALAPACVVRTGHSSAPPPTQRAHVEDHRGDGTITIANPPRPVATTASAPPPSGPISPPPRGTDGTPTRTSPGSGPISPPPRGTDGTPTQAGPNPTPTTTLASWMIYQRADKGCYAVRATECPPAPATCNPPPPTEIACPRGATEKKPLQVKEAAGGECFIHFAMPACPKPPATCNPPRPVHTPCPS